MQRVIRWVRSMWDSLRGKGQAVDHAEPSIGHRIRQLRGNLLTQVELAERAGVSVDLIRKLEQERRHTASITSLHRIARALDVDTAELLAKAMPLPSDAGPESGVAAIRRALTAVDDLLDVDDARDAPDAADAERTLTYAWGCYWTGRYELLAGLLPGAVVGLRAADRQAATSDRPAAAERLAELFQITGCTLVHLGYPDPSFVALRAGLDAADRGADPLRAATLRGSLAWLLLTQGRFSEARRLAVHAAERAEPPGAAPPPAVSVFGSLLLTGATAAGRDGQRAEAAGLLDAAGEAASRLGGVDRNDYETAFGPSQVTMQTVDVHVVTEEFGEALTAARRMPRDAGLPLAAQCRHLADLALAHTRLGHDQRALDTLLTMQQAAPDWSRYQTLPRQVVRELLERKRRVRTPGLRELADRFAITV